MGKQLKELLTAEVEANVGNKLIKDITFNILEACDDLNATEPASSSGKYHPVADLGKNGLIRHSIMVARIASIMIRGNPEYDGLNGTKIYLAGLLHDLCKYQKEEGEDKVHTRFDHPTAMADLVRKVANEYIEKEAAEGTLTGEVLDQLRKYWEEIALAISTHMSRWNTSKYAPGQELPTPETMDQWILSYADLVAANADLPDLMIQFKEQAVKELTGRA